MSQSENYKRPPPPFSRRIVIIFIDYRSTAYYVIPLITLFFRDKLENVITRFHCSNNYTAEELHKREDQISENFKLLLYYK